MLLCAVLQAKDVRHAELAQRLPGGAKIESAVRRVERFFDRHPLDQQDTARLVLRLLPDTGPRTFLLDRTNWQLGNQHVNVLVLAVVWRGVAVPLLFELLPHGGSSDQLTRQTLLDDALTLLTAQQVEVLIADREFIGHDWLDDLLTRGVHCCIRLRNNTLLDDLPASQWWPNLGVGERGLITHDVEVHGLPLQVAATIGQDGERVIVAGNVPAARLLALYRKRWKIECLFRHLKSKGFRLENTHMALHDHLERLLCLLTLAFVWSVVIGLEEPARIKGHGRAAWSAFTLGLRRLVQAFTRAASGLPETLLALITQAFASLHTVKSESVGY
ncbi:IS4 family transposase [Deinococcus aetherius]|uniref:IS4 family transposase n=1 Tax=Deinococcus aetherius TaxID=200252 RepID=A0ABM8ADD1_9DEIO|nr:IS4 family transposase [Deinococcus aetherius]